MNSYRRLSALGFLLGWGKRSRLSATGQVVLNGPIAAERNEFSRKR
jgi:hypothetical protein